MALMSKVKLQMIVGLELHHVLELRMGDGLAPFWQANKKFIQSISLSWGCITWLLVIFHHQEHG